MSNEGHALRDLTRLVEQHGLPGPCWVTLDAARGSHPTRAAAQIDGERDRWMYGDGVTLQEAVAALGRRLARGRVTPACSRRIKERAAALRGWPLVGLDVPDDWSTVGELLGALGPEVDLLAPSTEVGGGGWLVRLPARDGACTEVRGATPVEALCRAALELGAWPGWGA